MSITSKRLRHVIADNELWRALCFRDSFSKYVIGGTQTDGSLPIQEARVIRLQQLLARSELRDESDYHEAEVQTARRGIVKWDPTAPGEEIDWEHDYVARKAPLSLDWLNLPRNKTSFNYENYEATGLGVLDQTKIVVPLDDGSVSIWHMGDENGVHGKLAGRSLPDLLDEDVQPAGSAQRRTIVASKRPVVASRKPIVASRKHRKPDPGPVAPVIEGISIDTARNKAYIVQGCSLNEIDLTTLRLSGYERYPQAISVVSSKVEGQALTIGTPEAIYIHDTRARQRNGVLATDIKGHWKQESDFYRLYDSDDYAVLAEPVPLSIVHGGPDMIHVGGRFPCILNYDRRFFPNMTSITYSGARLSCLKTLPSGPNTTTLAAAGEYNGKGSVELYSLNASDSSPAGGTIRNRAFASRSKCLSIASHGSRLVYSDSDGLIKWVERDGTTIVRRWNINEYNTNQVTPSDLAHSSTGIFHAQTSIGDVARSLLPLSDRPDADIALWTGERIGVISFGEEREMWTGEEKDSEDDGGVGVASIEEKNYGQMMRRALEKQADEARFVRGLGL